MKRENNAEGIINKKISWGEEFNIHDDHTFFGDLIKSEEICHEFNNIPASHFEERKNILKKFFGKVNGDFFIFSPLKCGVGYNIEIGDFVIINSNCSLLDGTKIIFKNNIWVGPNCGFYTSGHRLDSKKRLDGCWYANPIVVEDNVWIGANSIIVCGEKKGITIGTNSVIAAGSVVTKDVPPNILDGLSELLNLRFRSRYLMLRF